MLVNLKVTDTTIQEKERSDEFVRLGRILGSSRSLDDFLAAVEEGISKRSNGVSGLTAAGARSLTEWWNYRNGAQITVRRTFVKVKGQRYLRYRNVKTGRFVSLASGREIYRLSRKRMRR